jgi:hypothetical protein
VGFGTLLFLLAVVCAVVDLPPPHAADQVVSSGGGCGWYSGGDHDGVRMDHHRGWAPAVDRLRADDGRGCSNRQWITFIAVVILYALLGATTILVLRAMSRRFRRAGGFTDLDTPYGPNALTKRRRRRRRRKANGRMSTAVAVVLLLAVVAYAVFGGADFGQASGTFRLRTALRP